MIKDDYSRSSVYGYVADEMRKYSPSSYSDKSDVELVEMYFSGISSHGGLEKKICPILRW